MWTDKQTENITSSRTTYAVGKKLTKMVGGVLVHKALNHGTYSSTKVLKQNITEWQFSWISLSNKWQVSLSDHQKVNWGIICPALPSSAVRENFMRYGAGFFLVINLSGNRYNYFPYKTALRFSFCGATQYQFPDQDNTRLFLYGGDHLLSGSNSFPEEITCHWRTLFHVLYFSV